MAEEAKLEEPNIEYRELSPEEFKALSPTDKIAYVRLKQKFTEITGEEKKLLNLTPWPKGYTPNPHGRPRKEKILMKDLDYILAHPWPTGVKLMERLRVEYQLPVGTTASRILAASAVFGATVESAKGNLTPFMQITDRLYGKPKESIEIEDKPPIKTIVLNEQQVDVMHEVLMSIDDMAEKHAMALGDGSSEDSTDNEGEMESVVVEQKP